MGPSVKFVSPNKGLISKKKLGVNFFHVKNDQTGGGGGGSGGGLAKDHTFSRFFFFNPPLNKIEHHFFMSPSRFVECLRINTLLFGFPPKMHPIWGT